MDINFVEKYVNDVFGYCIKRLNNIDDAKDLSQEILLEVIISINNRKIDNLDAWVWKIAHNRYARFISNHKKNTLSLYDDDIIETLAYDNDFIEDNADEINAVFAAIHSIVKSHRDILIDFYISELSYEQISEKNKLPINTVKTRLFYGKKKLKERWQIKMDEKKVYEKISWFLFGNGDVDPNKYLNRQIARAISASCYNKALSIDEISLVTGIPCLYIEDEIPMLLQGEIVTEKNGKYRMNIIINSEILTEKIEVLLKTICNDLAEKTTKLLDEYDDEIRQIGFIGNEKDKSDLWWFIIPIALREACEEARRLNGKAAREPFIIRKDGGKGWIFVNVSKDEKHKNISGCNAYYRDNSMFKYYWSSKYFDVEINNYLEKLEEIDTLGLNANIDNLKDDLIAEGIKYNIIEKVNNKYGWKIAVFTKEQIKMLNKLKIEIAKNLSIDLLIAVNKIYDMYLSETPKHLYNQINGVFGAEFNTVIAMVCNVLEEKGKLEAAKDKYFTKQIIMIMDAKS